MHLADVHACPRAQRTVQPGARELRHAARAIGTELAVVLGADLATVIGLDIAAPLDPVATDLRQARHDVDAGIRVGIGAAGVVHAQRRLARGGVEMNFAHRDVQRADVNLLRATNGAGGHANLGLCGDICHSRPLHAEETDHERWGRSLPTPVSAGSGSAGRGSCPPLKRRPALPRDGPVISEFAADKKRFRVKMDQPRDAYKMPRPARGLATDRGIRPLEGTLGGGF